jgi:hypothetical protein
MVLVRSALQVSLRSELRGEVVFEELNAWRSLRPAAFQAAGLEAAFLRLF